MGDIETNTGIWESTWDWSDEGDRWSAWWGGTPALWHGALLPRIHGFVPAGTILEIAPGFGRWTQFLKDQCEHLVVVDLAERCIDHCRTRFATSTNITYAVNDGRSLAAVADGAVDLAFSFDSLVHAEADVLEAYLFELAAKLAPNGVGLFHHSNMGSYPRLAAATRRFPQRLMRPLVDRGALVDLYAWRAESVTAEGFAAMCDRAGLACIAQERINWQHGRYLIDTLSLFTRKGSRWDRPNVVIDNPGFRAEARRMSSLWAARPR